MENVYIKLMPHPDNPNLGMKYVGAKEYLTAQTGRDGKIRTGLDENSIDILEIEDKVERKKIQQKIVKEREELQTLLNVNLETNSTFWDVFYVILEEEQQLDPINAMDRLKEIFLVANRFVAPSRESIDDDEKYQNCVYYVYREEVEISKKAEKQLLSDKASSSLFTIHENDPHKLKILASYLFGYNTESGLNLQQAYVKLREYITIAETDRQLSENIKTFLNAVKKSNEELMTKIIFDKAVRKKLITSKNGIYKFNDEAIGNSYDEAIEWLSSPENSSDLVSLKKQVDK